MEEKYYGRWCPVSRRRPSPDREFIPITYFLKYELQSIFGRLNDQKSCTRTHVQSPFLLFSFGDSAIKVATLNASLYESFN